MTLEQLIEVVSSAGGGPEALAYADPLFAKITALVATNRYASLFAQLSQAREEGDVRGRVLEVNFAHAFEVTGVALRYGAKQAMPGDIDFSFDVGSNVIFIETKLRTQDRQTRQEIEQQLEENGVYAELRHDDTSDIARLQIDLLQKSSSKKFNPKPCASWVNLVAIDVSELQLGTVDYCDCLLAAGGNDVAAQHCDPMTLRPSVLGFFEAPGDDPKKRHWLQRVQAAVLQGAHPREYMHGALFLFRKPVEGAALAYHLYGPIVWNCTLTSPDLRATVGRAIHAAIPLHEPDS